MCLCCQIRLTDGTEREHLAVPQAAKITNAINVYMGLIVNQTHETKCWVFSVLLKHTKAFYNEKRQATYLARSVCPLSQRLSPCFQPNPNNRRTTFGSKYVMGNVGDCRGPGKLTTIKLQMVRMKHLNYTKLVS